LHIHLISVGRKMPGWVEAAYADYARRLPAHCGLALVEIAPEVRGRNADARRAQAKEGERMLRALPARARAIALDRRGPQRDTLELAAAMREWLASGEDVALLVGGADGLAPACLERADERWSLSRLTFAHPLVRVILAEQIYRAWTVVEGHPYHRE
jgi:23S rRNA (pseudouridine1915-N3)-methyltransferase